MSDSKDRPPLRPGRSPDYCLTEAFEDLPQGAFIRPIEFQYVPKESKERLGIDGVFNERHSIVCYTAKGLKVIARSIIKER